MGRSAAHGSTTAKLRENQEARHMRAAFRGLPPRWPGSFLNTSSGANRSFRGIA